MAFHSAQTDFHDDAMVASPEDSAFLEQFRPAPLSWLFAWLFRPRRDMAMSEPEPFEEHINGLA